MNGPFILPVTIFQDSTYYPVPMNALEFRLNLIEIINFNKFSNPYVCVNDLQLFSVTQRGLK